MRLHWPFVLVLLGFVSSSAGATCTVPNGTFDTDVSGWTNATFDGAVGNPPGSTVQSPRVANTCIPAFSLCIPFATGESCSFTAQVFFATGQPTDGNGLIRYSFFSDTLCTALLSDSTTATTSSSNQNSWISLATGPVVAPPGAQSAEAIVAVCSGPSGGLVGRFDNAVSSSPSGPALPPGPFLTTSEIPGFQFKVRILALALIPGTKVDDCIAETLCVAGSIPSRAEVFLRVVGPKPNGKLWPTLVKFNTSQVEVWVQQIRTGQIKYYKLAAASPSSSDLSGLFDRNGFEP